MAHRLQKHETHETYYIRTGGHCPIDPSDSSPCPKAHLVNGTLCCSAIQDYSIRDLDGLCGVLWTSRAVEMHLQPQGK